MESVLGKNELRDTCVCYGALFYDSEIGEHSFFWGDEGRLKNLRGRSMEKRGSVKRRGRSGREQGGGEVEGNRESENVMEMDKKSVGKWKTID